MKISPAELASRYRVSEGGKFDLKKFDPSDTWRMRSKDQAARLLARGVLSLSEMQERLYAQDRWALLLIFQAMDAAGKDGTISHVMSGVNPQGCEVYSFKVPTPRELDHDFMWRTTLCLPERGRIGIFNRSYYEEVLAVRVHPEFLEKQRLPPGFAGRKIWKDRFEDINAFERYLTRNGTVIRKFFLNVSKEEQRKRFLSRLDESEKNWKFSVADVQERRFWPKYMDAYEDMIRHTATPHAPWFVVPADHKWFTRLVVADAIVDTLKSLNLELPKVDKLRKKDLADARVLLLEED
jgi:PPK2 family polyphosphate:nucleotide phosphotransferase